MSRDRHELRVELDADSRIADQTSAAYAAAGGGAPFRIALLGDFSGRANRGILESGRPLGGRRPVRVDRDTVDEVMARLSPALDVARDAGAPTRIRFSELDDFHPDRLFERLAPLRDLRAARDLAAAPAALGRQTNRASAGRQLPSGRSLLDQILGDVPAPPGGAAAAPAREAPEHARPGDALTDFVRRAVAPHVVADATPAQPERLAEVDAAVRAELRRLLHHPDFQALEAAWRTVDFLVRRIETDAALQIYLVDVSKSELATDLLDGADAGHSGIGRLLAASADSAAGESPWALLVGLFSFGPDAADVALLARLAAVARGIEAPLVAGADPRLVGCPSFGDAPDPDDWDAGGGPDEWDAAWNALRRSDDARYLGLAAPRFLLRLPYGGRDGQPSDVPGFEELSTPGAHDEYLWGNSAALCALLHADAFSAEGWRLRTRLDVAGLPLHLVRTDGEVTAKPCAEAVLGARAVEVIAERGVMAVQSRRDGDSVRIHRLQSIAEPLAALALRSSPTHADG